ncbi:hypothetical protein Sjap_025755 [Stephania japonica]|uniref:Uncharacterized protein n=1 Tax=Stephania japonica TaxID=461633 RepID=A0AAP0EA45_9MAGN
MAFIISHSPIHNNYNNTSSPRRLDHKISKLQRPRLRVSALSFLFSPVRLLDFVSLCFSQFNQGEGGLACKMTKMPRPFYLFLYNSISLTVISHFLI